MERVKRIIAVVVTTIFCFLIVGLLFMPYVTKTDAKEVICVYEDGTVQRFSFAQAYEGLGRADEDGIYLSDGGFILGSTAWREVFVTLREGELAQLLSMQSEGLTDFERASIDRFWGDTLFYDGEPFAWTGSRIARTERKQCHTLVLLSGDFAKNFLEESGATELYIRANAEPTAKRLSATRALVLHAEAPYFAVDNCLYLNHIATRLIAVTFAQEVVVQDVDYYDDGAFDACLGVQKVTLPFLCGEFRTLFSNGVPASLQSVRVLNGTITDEAFYACSDITEIDACGVSVEDGAFLGCASLNQLHTANGYVLLDGEYSKTRAACGCYIFTRVWEK